MEPFRRLTTWLLGFHAFNTEIVQIRMEIGIAERLISTLIYRITIPLTDSPDIGCMCLLTDAIIHILLGITDFYPAVMSPNIRSRIRINLRNGRDSTLDLTGDVADTHQSISFVAETELFRSESTRCVTYLMSSSLNSNNLKSCVSRLLSKFNGHRSE